MNRRSFLLSATGIAAGIAAPRLVRADAPGVTATDIKIGNTIPYSGPASSYGAIGRGLTAWWKMINDGGGIGGRKITFISYDDGYVPAKTVEQVRRLVEQDDVSFVLNPLGTPSNTAIQKYMNTKKVPQLFVATGADKWGNYKEYPWTIGWQPSYRTEAQIYAKYMQETIKDPKVAVLYQNDDFGKDYLIGLKDALGGKYDNVVVKTVSYEVTDPTIDSQAITLQGTGANVLVTAATPKFAAQMIRKIFDINWKPTHFMTNVSVSVGSVITPAGPEKAVGMITAAYDKDWTDPNFKQDAGMLKWLAFMQKYMPDADLTDANYVYAYGVGTTTAQVLTQCGSDLSRENIMKQAANLKDLEVPTVLPGIKINTSPTNYHPIRQMQLQKWNGKAWELFGSVIAGADV
ncbi:MAG TPA: ABC transporter substrate-binding protein [Acetobacteraceae bacterium]|jgi:branched-chain amino acid transport system substrate-binding protein|nr:ABC transporter substrate-binding protein [Acetobacteraceae bacterium]